MKSEGYKFGIKNNWRRQIWNEISSRIKVPKKEAIVVYLAGKEDLDRKVAIEKGFKPYNLIAIDRDKDVIDHLKSRGVLAIQGDLFDVIKGFCGNIDVLVADMCCGVTDEVYEFAKRMVEDHTCNAFNHNIGPCKDCEPIDDECSSCPHSCVDVEKGEEFAHPLVVFNFMRGRDKGIILNSFKGLSKHRGELFMEKMVQLRVNRTARCLGVKDEFFDNNEVLKLDRSFEELFGMFKDEREGTLSHYRPKYYSYKSNCGNIVMDSVIFNCIAPEVMLAERVNTEYTRVVGATMAIRTMRMNGKLKSCPSE